MGWLALNQREEEDKVVELSLLVYYCKKVAGKAEFIDVMDSYPCHYTGQQYREIRTQDANKIDMAKTGLVFTFFLNVTCQL